MATGNANFDALLTTTLHNYVSTKLEDVIFGATPILNAIRAKSGIGEKGGDKLVIPLLYGKNSTVKVMAPYDVFDTTPQEGITNAEFDWANLGGTVVLDNFTIDVQNAGESKVIDLLQAKINQLEMSMIDKLQTMLWTARVAGASYSLNGIPDMVKTTDPTWGAFGNIGRTANTWWAAKTVTFTHGGTTTTDMNIYDVNRLYNSSSVGNDHPDLIVMPLAQYERYEGLLVKTVERRQDEQLADSGIEHLKHKNASIIYDESCTANTVYALNTKYVKFFNCKGRNMKSTPFEVPHNQDVRVSKIIWTGQLGCSNCARQALATATDTTALA